MVIQELLRLRSWFRLGVVFRYSDPCSFLQDEMIKSGRLDRKYNGIIDCFKRTMADEGKL